MIKTSFDNSTKDFYLEYENCLGCGETEIYLNSEVNYPNGFTVKVEGNTTQWYIPEKNKVNVVSKEDSVKLWIERKEEKAERVDG